MNGFKFELITPEKMFFAGEIEALFAVSNSGHFAVLKNHEPMVAVLKPGPIRLKINGEEKTAVASEAFVEVRPDMTVLFATYCEWEEDFNEVQQMIEKQEEIEQERYEKSLYEQKESRISLARFIAQKHNKHQPLKYD